MIKKGKRRVRGKRASAVRRNSRRKRGHSLPSKNSLPWHSESHMPEVAGEKDPLEKEAEKTASKATGINSSVQMKADGVSKNSVSSSFVKTLNQSRDSGTPLPEKTQKSMSAKMGINFKDVRVHKGKEADSLNKEINARAFTYGKDIYFKDGHFQPDSKDGQKLIAHELVHTRQQTAKIHRAPEFDAAGNPTLNYIFAVGSGITSGFWTKAKSLTSDGPLSKDEASELRLHAVVHRGTVTHSERLFMAALMNPAVVPVFQAATTNSITVAFTDITRANRERVRQSGQEGMPDDINYLLAQYLWDLGTGSAEEVAETLSEMDARATETLLNTVGSYKRQMAKVIAYANTNGIFLYNVLNAALNGASDNSDGDQYMAALSYTVLTAGGFNEASRILSGQLKIDAMSDSAYNSFQGASSGAYTPVGNQDTTKGDTIYLRTSFQIDNVNHRALLVHEFTHFLQDLNQAASPGVTNAIPQEIAAYQAQAQYTMDQILAAATPADRASMIREAKNALSAYLQWAYIMITKPDQATYKDTCVAVLTQIPNVSEATINNALAMTDAQLTTNITNALTSSPLYSAGSQIFFDGNAGPSFMDHLN